MKYSIDTSALVEASFRSYPKDVFPSVWEKIDRLVRSGDLRATDEVLREIRKKDDDLAAWCDDHLDLFVPLDERVQISVTEILKDHKKLIDTRHGRSGADPFVIALAELSNATVVTNETPSGSGSRPRIPDVCIARGVRYMDMLGLMRAEGMAF